MPEIDPEMAGILADLAERRAWDDDAGRRPSRGRGPQRLLERGSARARRRPHADDRGPSRAASAAAIHAVGRRRASPMRALHPWRRLGDLLAGHARRHLPPLGSRRWVYGSECRLRPGAGTSLSSTVSMTVWLRSGGWRSMALPKGPTPRGWRSPAIRRGPIWRSPPALRCAITASPWSEQPLWSTAFSLPTMTAPPMSHSAMAATFSQRLPWSGSGTTM